jgi:hypothetical protein
MPSKKTVYECKYCRKEFTDYDECEEHEHTHICAYDEVDNERITKELRLLGEIASGYHIGGMVMSMPLKNYENLMEEAANRLEKRE